MSISNLQHKSPFKKLVKQSQITSTLSNLAVCFTFWLGRIVNTNLSQKPNHAHLWAIHFLKMHTCVLSPNFVGPITFSMCYFMKRHSLLRTWTLKHHNTQPHDLKPALIPLSKLNIAPFQAHNSPIVGTGSIPTPTIRFSSATNLPQVRMSSPSLLIPQQIS